MIKARHLRLRRKLWLTRCRRQSGDAASNGKVRPRTDRMELLDSRKERDEASKEAEDLKRQLKNLEGAKIRKELEAATSGKTSEKFSQNFLTFFL